MNKFYNLWTRRNLFVISKIFSLIEIQKDYNLKQQLLFGFIQTIHLCTKMSVPRRPDANRAFSTSWGRSAYIFSKRQMEMNPIYVFASSCVGKQSVKSSLESAQSYLGKNAKLFEAVPNIKKKEQSNYDIKFGSIDILNINDHIEDKSIDFIMTDPPYGGLVKYIDLSLIWLIWLQKIDKKYEPNLAAEITINKKTSNIETYQKRFNKGVENLVTALKDQGKIVFTFHNKDLKIWNAFLKSLFLAGLKVEKVIHQSNKRSGESNVSMPYGTSASDFYIRCSKGNLSKRKSSSKFENFVINKAIEIISERNEPTPYQFLLNGLLAEISQNGFNLDNFDTNIQKVLDKEIGDTFTLTDNTQNKSGNYWWFKDPHKHINYPDKKLSERVEDTVLSLLRREVSIELDDAIGEVFRRYPNGLTPDTKSISKILEKYATKSGGKFHYIAESFEKDYTDHTSYIYKICSIGKKLKYKIFIGKREQSEAYEQKTLSSYADYKNLSILKLKDLKKIKRIENIDLLWIKDSKIVATFEVENSTNFISGIQRGSNLDKDIPKIMIMPNKRKKEFTNISDPLFLEQFANFHWKYMLYSTVDEIYLSKIKNMKEFIKKATEL